MENSIGNTSSAGGVEISRKPKSLDLQSIYKSRVSIDGHSRKDDFPVQNGGQDRDDKSKEKKKKRKKIVKEVSLDSLEPAAKKSRMSTGEVRGPDVRSGSVSVDSSQPLSVFGCKNGLNGLSLSLVGSGNVFNIPKRPRGFVGRKKIETNGPAIISRPNGSVDRTGNLNGELKKVESSGSSSCKAGSNDKAADLLSNSGSNVGGSKVKRKRNVDEVKDGGNGISSSSRDMKDEGRHIVNNGDMKDGDGHAVNNSDKASKKKRSSHRKMKELQSGIETAQKKDEPSVDNSSCAFDDKSSKKRQSNHRKMKELQSGTETAAKKVQSGIETAEKKVQSGFETSEKKVHSGIETSEKKVQSGIETAEKKVEPSVDNSTSAFDDKSSKKRRSNHRKRKELQSGIETAQKKVEPSVDNSTSAFDDKSSKKCQSNHRRRKELQSGTETAQKKVEPSIDNSSSAFDDKSSRKRRSNHRKRKELQSGIETAQKKVAPSVDNSSSVFDDFQDDDDDEEKLEQNAARMLSSRFDPRCTGFTSRSRSSGSPTDNTVSFFHASRRDFVSGRTDSLGNLITKDASRVLRPRKELNVKGLSRKRRHFYEIVASNLDAYWFLNRRIKVYWPLDESWYYGRVSDYDPKRKLHHVEYDDRDEEWIDLQNEKFKLLLLPSEVPSNSEHRKTLVIDKHTDKRKTDSEDDDSFEDNYLDSEPIISWLSRSSHRVKPSPSSHLNEQKTLQFSQSMVQPVLRVKTDDTDVGSLVGDGSKSDSDSTLPVKSADGERAENSLLGSPSSSKGSPCVVYVRRHLRKNSGGHSPACRNDKAHRSPRRTFASAVSAESNRISWKSYDSFYGCSEIDKLFWSTDDQGLLRLRVPFGQSVRLRLCMSLPVLRFLGCSFLAKCFGFSHALVLPNYGTIMTTWPDVALEMLFVDNSIGLRYLLFGGRLKLALKLFALVLRVFSQSSGECKFIDMQLPITSIRFKFSCIQDLGRHQEFTFYSFSKLKQSTWIYLVSILQRYCLLSKQLPVSECTYDNIKTLEGGSYWSHTPYVGTEFFPVKKRFVQSILPVGVSRDSSSKRMSPSAVNSATKLAKIPAFALSFAAAPTFFLSLHLKLLMEQNFSFINFQDNALLSVIGDSEVDIQSTAVLHPGTVPCPENATGNVSAFDKQDSLTDASSQSLCSESCLGKDVSSEVSDADRRRAALNGKQYMKLSSSLSEDFDMLETDRSAEPSNHEFHNHDLEQKDAPSDLSVLRTSAPSGLSNMTSYSSLGGLSIELPSSDQNDKTLDQELNISSLVSDMGGNMSDGVPQSPCMSGLRSSSQRDRIGSSSSPFGDLSPVWPNRKSNFISNGFGNGPKKPRTQVQYTLPPGVYDSSSKYQSQYQKAFPYKRIRRSNEKRVSGGSRSSQKNLELLSCDANILVTVGDKGWRECGARIILELADQNEWRLSVKASGVTRYSYKVNHILQPGSTNRFTHAMMWKGGKDWVLEFPDRSQWTVFKEMHEECHNRNIRAASVKNIPIPGVRVIEESDDCVSDVLSIRNSPKYLRQVQSDVDMAMDPSRVLYDMDSDDEDWILKNSEILFADENKAKEVSYELFERIVDMLEKLAYSQQRDRFTISEIEELMVGIHSTQLVKGIYEHWQQKRRKKGMPLIRHLQPPLWERYQRQVKEWEQAMAKATAGPAVGCKEKTLLNERPPMFAFCLKPRGLEVPNKGSKQRSHRRFPVSGHSQAVLGDQEGSHTFGRRSNGFSIGDEKSVLSGNSCEFSDSSPSLQASARVFSPRDAGGHSFFSLSGDVPEWNHYPKYHRYKLKNGTFLSPGSSQLFQGPQRTIGMRSGAPRWNMELPEWPSQKHHTYEGSQRHFLEQLDGSDLHEFKLRDASGAAKHALNMAKLKRQRAQRLLYRADLAIHKAVGAVMMAEAKKAAFDSSNDDGSDGPSGCDKQ